jgi:hypothetical protein
MKKHEGTSDAIHTAALTHDADWGAATLPPEDQKDILDLLRSELQKVDED